MKTNKYLYGKVKVPKVPEKVVNKRIKLLNKNLTKVLNVHFMKRDDKRLNDIVEDIDFWQNINKGCK